MAQVKRDAYRSGAKATTSVTKKASAFRMLPAMHLEIEHQVREVEVSCDRKPDDLVFNLRRDTQRNRGRGGVHFMNPYSERELFLKVRSPREAMEFLTMTGFFRFPEKEVEFDPDSWKVRIGDYCDSMKWSDFKLWQQLIRLGMTQGGFDTKPVTLPGDPPYTETRLVSPPDLLPLFDDLRGREKIWLLKENHEFFIGTRRADSESERMEFFATVSVACSLEAMLATIYVDGLNGINYGLCKFKDCSALFEIRTKHEREYCSQPCAHKASIRKRRAIARAERDAAKARQACQGMKEGE